MRENAFTHYNRDNTLYNRLIASATDGKLPILTSTIFEKMNAEYGKDKMRTHLADYIASERPVFPLKEITNADMRISFGRLKQFDTSTICIPNEQVEKEVFEKYDDYKYPYSKWGLGLINGASTFNDVSNYFMQDLRLECSSYGFRAPKEVWENGDAYAIWKCLGPIWRGINDVKLTKIKELDGTETEKLVGGRLDEKSYISAFRLGTYIATQFKPVVAKAIYDMTEAKTVLDTSCGWGDRLAGFFASDAEEYYGCDPNPNTYQRYQEQIATYNKLLSKPKKVQIWNCGAEDLPYHKLPKIDVAFTSPPYFSTEQYNKGGEKEELQSWHKFNEYDKWRDDFYLPVAEKTMEVSKFMFVNIMDPKIHGVRYRSGDELVDKFKDKFLGQIGMRIMQRPKSDTLFKDEKEKAEFMNKMFIENVWCFGPETDLFKNSRKATLDEFFA
tara:strand:- start:85 stop:1413 length:1329 start_codon:yes stop_codon:yes gene_type:complete